MVFLMFEVFVISVVYVFVTSVVFVICVVFVLCICQWCVCFRVLLLAFDTVFVICSAFCCYSTVEIGRKDGKEERR